MKSGKEKETSGLEKQTWNFFFCDGVQKDVAKKGLPIFILFISLRTKSKCYFKHDLPSAIGLLCLSDLG